MRTPEVVDYEGIMRRYAVGPGGDRGRPMAEAERERFAVEVFIRPARRLLTRLSCPPPVAIRRWMEFLNDQDPRWRLRRAVRRFCRSRRREYLVEACVREDLELFQEARGFRKARAAWKKTQVDRVRYARRIVRTIAARIRYRQETDERRDCLFVIRRLTLGGMERAQVAIANAVRSTGRTVDILNLGSLDPSIAADLDPRVQLVDTRTALRRRYVAAVNYSNWHFPEIVTRGVKADRKMQWVHSDLLWIFDRFPRNKWACEYRRMDKVVCVSDSSRRGFCLLYPFAAARTETIYSFYDMERIGRRALEKPVTTLPRDVPVVLTVARLADAKGIERAVRVHRMVADRGIDFRWYIVGEGTMRSKIEALIRESSLEDRFILLGEIANPYPLMMQADVFVLPSFHEGFGLTTLEAMTLRIPVLLADFGSARESVTDGFNGVIAPSNVRGLAEGLERLLTDAALRETLRRNLSTFTWDNAAILGKIEKALFGAGSQ